MMTRSPRPAAARANSAVRAGERCAEAMSTSYATPNSSSMRAASRMISRSESEPITIATSGLLIRDLFSQFQRLQILAKLRAQSRALQGKLHRGLQEAELVAGVVALAFEDVAVDLLARQEHADGVGDLQFAADAERRVLQAIEDCRRQDVAADNGHVRRRVFRLGLLHHVAQVKEPIVAGDGGAIEHAVGRDARA